MRVEQIQESFQIDVGAPNPTILANESQLYLTFYFENLSRPADGVSVHERSQKDKGIVTVKFDRFLQYKFGSPNNETIQGHPLFELGLRPYAIQRVIDSSWIRTLSDSNSVHPHHNPKRYENYQHFVFFFHDTCFEIVADGYAIDVDSKTSMRDEILRVAGLLS